MRPQRQRHLDQRFSRSGVEDADLLGTLAVGASESRERDFLAELGSVLSAQFSQVAGSVGVQPVHHFLRRVHERIVLALSEFPHKVGFRARPMAIPEGVDVDAELVEKIPKRAVGGAKQIPLLHHLSAAQEYVVSRFVSVDTTVRPATCWHLS